MVGRDIRVNDTIRVKTVRLIDDHGEQQGIIPTQDALRIARERDLDLVEVSPSANPPVCKLMDYGKYRFEQEKKNRESKKKQKQIKIKEIRMQPKIDDHDLEFKVKHMKDFLEDGCKVKVTVRFRGRELAHTELGREVLDHIIELLGDVCTVETPPTMEGRLMSMFLSPTPSKKKG